jgi:hypothetical protein
MSDLGWYSGGSGYEHSLPVRADRSDGCSTGFESIGLRLSGYRQAFDGSDGAPPAGSRLDCGGPI